MMSTVPSGNENAIDIQEILDQNVEVFAEPKSLPHVRALDHSKPLKPGAMPLRFKPYRYNYHQKEELEK